MERHGYTSQRAIARALHEKVEYYRNGKSSSKTTNVFLNQVLLGRRPMPSNLANGLIELCEGDERLTSLLEQIHVSKTKTVKYLRPYSTPSITTTTMQLGKSRHNS